VTAPLVILGPTASGKSALALAYAQRHGHVEILAIDAMQVYRRMDIGTAKPTAADQRLVPHHGIDLVEPSDDFALTDFQHLTRASLAGIAARGARPVLVAGTGLYLRGLTDPMEVPGRWPDVRAELERRVAALGPFALHTELAALDPVAAGRMEPSNARRVVRALEVTLGSGRQFSSYGPGLDQYPPIEFAQIGLQWSRPALTARIAERVHVMLAAGLVAEVAALLAESRPMSRTARQALGYKELIEHLEGRATLDEAVASIILRTRQFAVRQERWFRRDPRIRWVHIEHDPVEEVLPVLLQS
jgi:tRNA dimethylallyltransferase